MLEIVSSHLQFFSFNHHGLIAAVHKDLKIAERIDAILLVHETAWSAPDAPRMPSF